jgi:hypothetical protein
MFGKDFDFMDYLNGFLGPDTDSRYQEAKRKSNLTLYKMKSGRYKIMDYYKKVVYECDDIVTAKKYFIKITIGE